MTHKENTAEKIEDLERKKDRLDELARQVAEDARVEPEKYLRETIVPEGGE